MRLLCLSDLHLRSEAVVAAIDRQRLSPFPAQIAATVAEVSPDAVVVTGDTVSPAQVRLLSATLRTFIPADLPVVATLGNHEFWGRTFEDTLAKLKEQTLSDPNIFYLDLIGAVELNGGELRRRDAVLRRVHADSGEPADRPVGRLAGLAHR